MAIEAVTSNAVAPPITGAGDTMLVSSDTTATTKKVDPNSEAEISAAAIEAFVPSMVSNTLMLNNTLFNFAKEAIDEGSNE